MASTFSRTTILALLIGCFASLAHAQSVSIATVNMERLYRDYYKTREAEEKIQSSVEKAQEQSNELIQEGQDLVAEYRAILERAENPALTEEAKAAARNEAAAKLEEIQTKEREVQQFQVNTQRQLQQRRRTHRDLMLDEIRAVVSQLARARKATLVFDTSGANAVGVPAVLYADSSWDMTDAVLKEINKDAPPE